MYWNIKIQFVEIQMPNMLQRFDIDFIINLKRSEIIFFFFYILVENLKLCNF